MNIYDDSFYFILNKMDPHFVPPPPPFFVMSIIQGNE